MHTIKLHIDDTIFDKFMGLLEMLPKDKIQIADESEYPSITFAEAKIKVEKAINNISSHNGISLDDAIAKVLKS
jgi:hypothetical protein